MTDLSAATEIPVPRYGEASLADVMPSVLAALGVGDDNRLGLPDTARAVVVLVDGMGLVGLQARAEAAPFLSSLSCRELTAGFPSTTVTSLASLSTGLPAGEHGMTGYSSYVEEVGEPVNWLSWRQVSGKDDLREILEPEEIQSRTTVWQQAADAGVSVTIASSRDFEGTGLTRAVFRGGSFRGVTTTGDMIAHAADAADRGHRSLVYTYASELDFVGHVRGPASDSWTAQLSMIDRQLELLAQRLPAGTSLYVTADHGMADVAQDEAVDADEVGSPLRDGVIAIAGEPRMRHVHARPGAAADVLATWRSVLGERAWVLDAETAIGSGLFGRVVTPSARARIGDVVAIAQGRMGIVQRKRESRMSALPGHHGALTDDELLVPLLSSTV
ncbi:MAG TPA: alkaline phosphatase family protein [Mycobacteriales bacterium]|nr:alkaline phosphatase family protein [Mycobacteriales bacterium]